MYAFRSMNQQGSFFKNRGLWGLGSVMFFLLLMTTGCAQPDIPHQQSQQSLTTDAGSPMPDMGSNPFPDEEPSHDAGSPWPDYMPPMPDFNFPMPDYMPPTPDYNVPMPDYMPPTPDYNVPMPDYMPPTPDYNVPMPDYMPPTPDYMPPMPDYNPPTPDYMPPMPDYVGPTPDYMPPMPDYVGPDAGNPGWDVDTGKPDMAVPPPDRAVPAPDQPVGPEAPPEKEKLCCVCEYWSNGRCGGLDQATCGRTRDCQWADRKCMPRHEKDCIDWMANAAQKDCDEKKIQLRGADPTGGLRGCTKFRYNYEGHGLGCNNLTQRVKVCINKLPQCTRFDIEDTGCSTFNDLAAANTQMQTIIASLGGEQCVTVSANQCTASNVCQSRYTYTINSKTCTGQPDPCNSGGRCHAHNEVAQCRQNNRNTVQICCCDRITDTKNCAWEVGNRMCQYTSRPCNDGGACSPQGRLQLCSTGQGISSQVCCCDGNGRNCAWKARVRSCN